MKHNIETDNYLFGFDNELQAKKFEDEYPKNRLKMKGQFLNWYGLDVDMDDYADVSLYCKIVNTSKISISNKKTNEVIESWQDLRFVGVLETNVS